MFWCLLCELPHIVDGASMVSSNFMWLPWFLPICFLWALSFSLSQKHTGCMGEPSNLALNVYQVPVSRPHPCLGPQSVCVISLSESKTMLLSFMTALPGLPLHKVSCHCCLTGNGCTQSKASITYSSQNALGHRSEIPSRCFGWWHWP